ncbi:MAG: hypothetical protein Q8K37_02545, partial [Alphaproteobacteria bacterium]|nr:hypothetical protein [Alphaproteobacteria bacterium]
MLKKIPFFTFIMISLVSTHSFALDVLEKELLKKNQRPSENKTSETNDTKKQPEQNNNEQSNPNKIKVSPMPNHFFTDQAAADLYRESLTPTNEEGLLNYFDNAEGLTAKSFKSPKSKEYLPPSTDDMRGFKVYKKSKDKENIQMSDKEKPQAQKMFKTQHEATTHNNCASFQDLNER